MSTNGPEKDKVEALLALVADEDDRAVLERILEALSINRKPTDADVEVYNDLWDTFGEDVEGSSA